MIRIDWVRAYRFRKPLKAYIPKEEEVAIVAAALVPKWRWRTFAGFTLFFFLVMPIGLVLASWH
jgi:hypothetical protein